MTTALALRIAGHPLAEIADRLGYPDTDTAAAAVRAEIALSPYGRMPEQHALHLLRLDEIANALTDRDPDDQPERAARLLGRIRHQRLTVLVALAESLQRADSRRQTEDTR